MSKLSLVDDLGNSYTIDFNPSWGVGYGGLPQTGTDYTPSNPLYAWDPEDKDTIWYFDGTSWKCISGDDF